MKNLLLPALLVAGLAACGGDAADGSGDAGANGDANATENAANAKTVSLEISGMT